MEDPYLRGTEEYYESSGSQQPLSDSDTTLLFRDLEHELEIMIQRYHVPPEDLEQLFQVVQSMFELMDSNREAYDRMEVEKNELEDLWKQEKDKLRSTQRRKLELECRLEEERMKIESEKTTLEKEKVVLQTKLKQVGEHKEDVEQELHRIKERTSKEERIRKELLEQYKKQADIMKTQSLRRRASPKSAARRRLLPVAPDKRRQGGGLTMSLRVPPTTGPLEESGQSASLEESGEIPQIAFTGGDSPAESRRGYNRNHVTFTKKPGLSLEEELKQQEENPNQGAGDDPGDQNGDVLERSMENGDEDGEGMWFGYQDTEGTSLLEEMMDPLLSAPMRAEVEMLQKEKEMWEEERGKLEQATRDVRTEKENIEGTNAQILVEVRQLKENCQTLQEELAEVRNERDEILGHYLEQPFEEYCITRKELNELLKKHQKTALELAEEKEAKERLERLLASKRGFLDRFKERMKKMFTKHNTSGDTVSYIATGQEELEKSRTLSPLPTPLVRSLVPILTEQNLKVEKGWLMSCDSQVTPDKLPQWVGQIILQGMDTEKIENIAVGRVFHSPLELFPGHMTPPRLRVGGRTRSHPAAKLLAGIQQLHAEVWVSTTEASSAYIEIIDVISKPAKVRQRFVVRPKTKHIICMKSIPGFVEESKDYVDSAYLTSSTSWVESSFLQSRHQTDYLSQSMDLTRRLRPSSAPQRRNTYGAEFMISTPDLSIYSEPGPLEFFGSNKLSIRAAADPKPNHRDINLNDSSNSLTTINEIDQTTPTHVSQGTHTPSTSTPRRNTTQQEYKSERYEENGGQVQDGLHLEVREETDSENPTSSSSSSSSLASGNISPLFEKRELGPKFNEVTSTPVSGYKTKKPLRASPLNNSSSMNDGSPLKSGSNVPSIHVDTPVGRSHGDRTKCEGRDGKDPVMWIVTASDTLYFYPTAPPSHKPINSVKLHARAICVEYIKGKVIVGHIDSSLSVYYMDEFSHTWDINNPERISLPSPNPKEVYDVQCIAAVGDRIWVGAGPSIFFLDAELPASREGSIFLDSWRRRPKQILPLGDIVVVTSSTSCLYVFDSQSAHLIQKLNINSIAKLLDLPMICDPDNASRPGSPLTKLPSIKSIVADDTTLFIGTSTGKVLAVPISALTNLKEMPRSQTPVDIPLNLTPVSSPSRKTEPVEETDGFLKKKRTKRKKEVKKEVVNNEVKKSADDEWEEIRSAEEEDIDGQYLEDNAISLHTHNDSQVQSLIHLLLPDNQISKLKAPTDPVPYHSMPNLTSPFGGRVPISPPIVSYRSLVLSAGKGHMEYVMETDNELLDESTGGALRERNEAFQMLVWGHKNVLR